MWQKPGGRGMRFTASQRFAVERVAFSWQARFPLVGSLAIKAVDDYADGEGKLEVRVLGLPLQRQRGRETAIGEALRYLAELPWAPYAIANNRELEWHQTDNARVEVATRVDDEPLVVEFEFDGAGDIVRASSQTRLIQIEKRWVRRPLGRGVQDLFISRWHAHPHRGGGLLGPRAGTLRLLAGPSHVRRATRRAVSQRQPVTTDGSPRLRVSPYRVSAALPTPAARAR
jgi:hypothetical protein